MSDTTFSDEPPPPPPPPLSYSFENPLPQSTMDQDLTFLNPPHQNYDVSLEDIDFDISIDDLDLLPFDPTQFGSHHQFYTNPNNALKTTSPEFLRSEFSPASSTPNSPNFVEEFQNSVDVSSYLNVESPEEEANSVAGSNKSANSVSSSPNFDCNSIKKGVVDQEIKLEEKGSSNYLLKRKKGSEDSSNNVEDRINKYHKLSSGGGSESCLGGEDDKRKARLVRNRESAHLSRQRKKLYVEELEDKVKAMHSTIQDLNAKVSYIMAENVSLRQQMGNGGMGQPMMYPGPQMMYPWMGGPHYMVKAHGSQVPLVPIPRLKPQQVVAVGRVSKKGEGKKSEGRSKKVASVSFLGLLLFMMLFGGLVPMVNVRYGGMRDAIVGGVEREGVYERHHGRVLTVNGNGSRNGEKVRGGPDISSNVRSSQDGRGRDCKSKDAGDEFVGAGNGSEPLMASLYVPRNDKLVKIDGNLIIHSILASDKAMASHEINKVKKSDDKVKKSDDTGLAVSRDVASTIPRRNTDRHPHLALASGAENENSKSTAADHRLQQWFREGLAGPMLSSGMCTEVFQFEASSAAGAIIPATSSANVSAEGSHNASHVSKGGRNRRILHGLPIPLPGSSSHNISEDRTRGAGKRNYTETGSSASSMVVSVLVDPREAADAEGDGVMGPKSLSRIFVVVLIDSVKYVTYSCMLPFKGGSFPHLVTT